MWYLIVSIPDLCNLITLFHHSVNLTRLLLCDDTLKWLRSHHASYICKQFCTLTTTEYRAMIVISKMHPVTYVAMRSMARFCCYWFFVECVSLWGSLFVLCFVVHCFVSFLVLQSYCYERERESWLFYFAGLPCVLWLILFCGSSSWCQWLVFSVCLWYFLIKLNCFCFC